MKRMLCLLMMLLLAAGCAQAEEDRIELLEGFSVLVPQDARSGETFTLRCTEMAGATQYFFLISATPDEEGRITGNYTEMPEWQIDRTDLGAGQYYARAVVYRESGMGRSEWSPFTIGEPAPENLFLFGEYSETGVTLRKYMASACPEVLEIPEMAGDKYVRRVNGDFVTASQKPRKILLPKNAEDVDGIESIVGASFLVYTGSAGEEYCILHKLPYELADDGTPDFEVEIDGEPMVNEKTKFYLKTKADQVFLHVNGERWWHKAEDAGKRGLLVERNLFEQPGTYVLRFMTVSQESGERQYSRTMTLSVGSKGAMPAVQNMTVERPVIERRSFNTISWDLPDGYRAFSLGRTNPEETEIFWIPIEISQVEIVNGHVDLTFHAGNHDLVGTHTIYVALIPEEGMTETISSVSFEVVSTREWLYDESQSGIFGYEGTETDVVFPADVDGYPVDSICTDSMQGSSFTSMVLPENYHRISIGAFSGSKELRTLKILGKGAVVFENAFSNCSALTDITLPEGVILWQNAFVNCHSLVNIEFLGAPKSLGPDTFANCTSLEEVVFPEGMTSLTSNAFSECTSLKAVTFPRSLKEIGSQITPRVLPEGVTIRGYQGSRAEAYAKAMGYPFEALDD